MTEPIEHFAPPLKRDFTEEGIRRWLARLHDSGELGLQACDALRRLTDGPCERNVLVFLLMNLHLTQRWEPVSRKDVQRALDQTKRLEPSVRALSSSQLRDALGLDNETLDENAGWSLLGQLTTFRERLEEVVHRATEREDVEFNQRMEDIVGYVRSTTHRWQDDELSTIVTAILGRTFSSEGWRKRHHMRGNAPSAPGSRSKKQTHRVGPRKKDRP